MWEKEEFRKLTVKKRPKQNLKDLRTTTTTTKKNKTKQSQNTAKYR